MKTRNESEKGGFEAAGIHLCDSPFVFTLDVSSHTVVCRGGGGGGEKNPISLEKLLVQTQFALMDGEPHVSGRTGVVEAPNRSSVFSDCG